MKRTWPFLMVFLTLFCVTSSWAAGSLKIEKGKEVTLAYQLYVNGDLLEAADSKDPFVYVHGQNQIIPGLEKGLDGLRKGEKKTVRVPPKEAYGLVDPKALQEFEKEKLPPDVAPQMGTLLEARDPNGLPQLVKIVEVKEKTVVIDFNHPLAGKELEFQIEVLSIK